MQLWLFMIHIRLSWEVHWAKTNAVLQEILGHGQNDPKVNQHLSQFQ